MSYHLPEDEDHSLQSTGSKFIDHSLNELDISTLPNSYDFNLLPTDSFLIQSNSDCLILLLYLIYRSFIKEEFYAINETYSDSWLVWLVEDDFLSGTTSFPSNSYTSYSYTPFTSSQPGFRSDRSNSLMSSISSFSTHMNSSSILLSSYKGKPLDISESKKLNEFNSFYTNLVELVCTQNGSKSLQVYSYIHFYIYRHILILLCLKLYVRLWLIRLFKKLNLLVVRSFVTRLVIISIKFLFFISIHFLASL